jgi:hypothetical protein
MQGLWSAIAPILTAHVWLAVPITVLGVIAWQTPKLMKVILTHRREMWKLRMAEARRTKTLEMKMVGFARSSNVL